MACANLEELLPLINDQINAGGEVRFKPRGISMLPFLMEGRDEVILAASPEKLKKGDIPFYRRDEGGFVLHRIVGIDKDGSYVLCGDNQYHREHGVKQEQIIAVVKAVYRKGKYISADDLYFKLWGALWPKYRFFYGILARIYHKLGRIVKI